MNLKNLSTETQLKIGFGVIFMALAIISIIGWQQTDKMAEQTRNLYNHPIVIRRALSDFEAGAITMRVEFRNILLAKNEAEWNKALFKFQTEKNTVDSQFPILYDRYLGPRTDIDSLKLYLRKWSMLLEKNIEKSTTSYIDETLLYRNASDEISLTHEKLFSHLEKIEDFAKNKTDLFYRESQDLNTALNRQFFIFVFLVFLMISLVVTLVTRNIRKPIVELTRATKSFQDGNFSARSFYKSGNQFGILSDSFNDMADRIQTDMELNERAANLVEIMLSENDAKRFFQKTLANLANVTGSQMAAAYLLSDDKKRFDHFTSIGLDENVRKTFNAKNPEGEFGLAIASHKIQFIKNIGHQVQFVFNTTSGTFVPNEILVIPIVASDEVIAILSFACLNVYTPKVIQLIQHINATLTARVEGILAYRKIKDFSQKMEQQNHELEAQKAELASQSLELTEQNTELEMQKLKLGEVSRLKTSFLSNMSHELRTPLNSVIALSGLLNRRLNNKIPEEEYSYLEVIERNGKQLLSLINDILDISRIESGQVEVECTKFNLNLVISELVNMIEPLANGKNIQLIFNKGKNALYLNSDEIKCRHILQNLIANAVKFTEKGSVEITARQKENSLEVLVKDTGIGISEDQIHHIFDEFRQADGSTSRKFGGTGLGLAIAKKYASLLGGTIAVYSVQGSGSEFVLKLPKPKEAENLHPKNNAVHKNKKRFTKIQTNKVPGVLGKTILLIEDSEVGVIQMEDVLAETGYETIVARNGSEALKIVDQFIPDSIVLDLMMPEIDGFEVLKSLRDVEKTAHIPVLILTAKAISKEELKFLKRNKIHQLIQKGDVKREQLLNAVNTMIFPLGRNNVNN